MKTIYFMMKRFKIDPKTVDIIYDVDDVLWDLVGKLCRLAGIDYNSWFDFYITKNTHWEQGKIDEICGLLSDERVWEKMEFYPGIEDIMRPVRDFGVNLKINSKSHTNKINESKHDQLLAAIPGLTEDSLVLTIAIPNVPSLKDLGKQAVFFVDDNPYHMAGSTARFNVMPRRPWNISPGGMVQIGNTRITRLNNLQQINDFIYRRLQFYLQYAC